MLKILAVTLPLSKEDKKQRGPEVASESRADTITRGDVLIVGDLSGLFVTSQILSDFRSSFWE